MRAAAGPVPVLMAWWLQPASVTLPKHWSPSLTTVQPGSRLRLANAEIDLLQKLVTRRSFKRTGLPSGVASTAATPSTPAGRKKLETDLRNKLKLEAPLAVQARPEHAGF